MPTISRVLLLASVVFVPCFAASSDAATTVNLTCSATKRLQSAIDSAAAGVVTTINLSNSCTENITVPQGKTVIIKGTTLTSQIVPKDITLPAVISRGDTTLQSLTLSNSAGSAEALVEAEYGGVIQLVGDTLTAPGVDSVVGIWDNSTGFVFNTSISGGVTDAIDLANAGSLVLGANPALAGNGTSLISNTVGCGPGSSLFLRVKRANGTDGSLTVNGVNAGLSANQCAVTVWNKTQTRSSLKITGQNGAGINLNRSTLTLQFAQLIGSSGPGLDATESSATILNSEISQNGGDINAGPGSTVTIQGWAGANVIPGVLSGNTMTCWPSANHGNIFADPESLGVTTDVLDTIVTTNFPCLTRSDF